MVFSSLIFLFVFLPITLVLYYIVAKPLKNPVLILCSLIFYAWETPQYLVLMLFSVVFNYCAGLELDDLHQRGKPKAAKWVMIAVVVMNLFLLGFFKYSGFLVENLNHIPGVALTAAKVALPVGISFYTFQVLSYVFDVYRRNVPVQRNFVLFATYVTFFPKLVSGPIVTYKDMEAQLRERQVSLDRICSGATLFLTGLFKKVLIADNLGVLYAGISGQSGAMSVVTAWLEPLATPYSSISISVATLTWPSAWVRCLALTSTNTLTTPTCPRVSPSFGAGGTSPWASGSGIMCTSPWAAAGCVPVKSCATCSSSGC